MTVENIIKQENVQGVRYFSPTPGTSTDSPSIVVGGSSVGGQDTLVTADMTTRELLSAILVELKKLNLRQDEAFEETVLDEDVSCE